MNMKECKQKVSVRKNEMSALLSDISMWKIWSKIKKDMHKMSTHHEDKEIINWFWIVELKYKPKFIKLEKQKLFWDFNALLSSFDRTR